MRNVEKGKMKVLILCMVILASLSSCDKEKKLDTAFSNKGKEVTNTQASESLSEQLSIEQQLQLIVENEQLWKLDYREKDSYGYYGAEYYHYAVTDLNQNGRLEILSNTYNGNGHMPWNDCFEVSEDGKALEKVPFKGKSKDADIYLDEVEVYWEKETKTYHYDFADYQHGSAAAHTLAYLDFVMGDGEIKASVYGYLDQRDVNDCNYYAGNKRKKITEKEFGTLEEKHYAGWESKKATFGWFYTVQKDENENVIAKKISSEELYQRLQNSYETFGFHENP